jgi:hypothetical protein
MMEISSMWCDKALGLVLFAAALSTANAAPVRCPASLTDAGVRHVLANASLYDGPPEQMADLIPVPSGHVDRWSLDGQDPYLVCKYDGTAKTATLHPKTAKVCEAGGKPFKAYCR